MQPIFGLWKKERLRAVSYLIGYFLTPMSREAVHYHRIGAGLGHQGLVYLIGRKNL
jgi:hypothetical protein